MREFWIIRIYRQLRDVNARVYELEAELRDLKAGLIANTTVQQ